jgi:cyclopropane fatty-acyl-phospholipid synthase-like methyltransferase
MSSLGASLKRSVFKILRPDVMLHVRRLQKNKKKNALDRVRRDPQLELYSRILRRDFLHYGYFADPAVRPETLSFEDLEQAQLAYAELFLEALPDSLKPGPVLDLGCGMGGLSALLQERGFKPVALSPDEHQVRYICEKHPSIETIQCKGEELEVEKHRGRFSAVITSESLQYLKLDQALPVIEQVLRPGGKWLICDYFRTQARTHEKSGHVYSEFLQEVARRGWRVEQDRDVTAHVLVTLRYAQMFADRLLFPLLDFAVGKLEVKQPGVAFLLKDWLPEVRSSLEQGVKTIDPSQFAQDKSYRFMVLSR